MNDAIVHLASATDRDKEIIAMIAKRLGINTPDYRLSAVHQAIRELSRHYGSSDELMQKLADDNQAAWQDMISRITIPETYMFRHKRQFDLLAAHIHTHKSRTDRPYRVLCAGCSSGEEAWSVAAVAAKVYGPLTAERVSILGVDLDRTRIAKAQQGMIKPWAMRRGLYEYSAFFQALDSGCTPNDTLRNIVHFQAGNLLSMDPKFAQFDCVMFRNVAIYWDENTVNAVVSKLVSLISDDGVFVPGPSDHIIPDALAWEQQPGEPMPFYKRRTGSETIHLTKPGQVVPINKAKKRVSRLSGVRRTQAVREKENKIPRRSKAATKRPKPVDQAIPTEISLVDKVLRLADQQQYQSALELLEQSSDHNCTFHGTKGIILMNLNAYEEAIDQFRKALYLEPEQKEYRQCLAISLQKIGLSEEAEREFRNAKEIGDV